jgi:UDPglucose 6-dehydrogenase
MKIAIIGTGYVGLVTGTCFAETGIDVTCVDIDAQKIDNLKKGIVHIWEPNLDDLVLRNVKVGRLHFTTTLADAIKDADAVFIAVGTPAGEDGSADLSYVLQAARQIGQYVSRYLVVVTKSTVPVGTSVKVKQAVQDEIGKRGADITFDVVSNPEFLKEGSAIDDFMKPDRIVVGVDNERAQAVMERLYKPFVLNGHPVFFMDIISAELTKYAANAMLATKISFINDIANLCERVGADIMQVRRGIAADARIGGKFIYPGTGYGGSCFPKDVKAIIHTASDNGYSMKILEAVEDVNERQKGIIFDKMKAHFGGNLADKRIAVWGLAFKPNTDDVREAPSLTLVRRLLQAGAVVCAYDPVAMKEFRRYDVGGSIEYADTPYDALKNADALALMTEWTEFRQLNYDAMKQQMRQTVVYDGRNIYNKQEMEQNGFVYYCIGGRV